MSLRILTLALESERDVVVARQRSRQIAGLLGFEAQDQTRVATAVSEIARNALRYARGGRVEFALEGATPPQVLLIHVSDRGPGIADLEGVLHGSSRSKTGMGIGIAGSRRLMDGFEIASGPDGTRVALKKLLPRAAPLVREAGLVQIVSALRAEPRDVYEEMQRQNQELLRTLDELRLRQEELLRLNHELQDTNRGVLALYAELDEKADHLRRAYELKTRFLSDMSHEFRTPLNSTLALTRLLLDRLDGPLTGEQERQVALIRDGAAQLLELVNDMLDLAKAQAGKVVVRPIEFHVRDLFGALRGMLRPLLVGDHIDLVIEAPDELPALYSDEGKVSQVLRNLISNALKFTERGEVRVSAEHVADDDRMRFVVADTGIGIAPEDRARIFEEFGQLDHPIQQRVRGTGLGLPLSRQLATLLGGTLAVESEPRRGSRFTLEVPRVWAPAAEPGASAPAPAEPALVLERLRVPVLVVEDDPAERVVYESLLRNTRFQALAAASLREARELLARATPAAVVLDIRLEGEDTWQFLADVKSGAPAVPVLVVTSVNDERKALALGADAFRQKPLGHEVFLAELVRLSGHDAARAARVLVIDDDDAFRYALRRDLERLGCTVEEAATGDEGVQRARAGRPELVFLDLQMPTASGDGEAALELLRDDARTASVPIVLVSASEPDAGHRLQAAGVAAFVPKGELSPERLEELLCGGARKAHSRAQPSRSASMTAADDDGR